MSEIVQLLQEKVADCEREYNRVCAEGQVVSAGDVAVVKAAWTDARIELARERSAIPGAGVAEVVCRLIEADPHQWSSRPCSTCKSVSELIGRSFGCVRRAEQRATT